MSQRVLIVTIAVFGMVSAAFAQTDGGIRLIVKLTGQYDPNSTVCTRVRTEEPFEVVLTNGKKNTIFWGELRRPKKRVFQLELAVFQGNDDVGIFDRGIYQLQLGVAVRGPVVVETSNHPSDNPRVDREITLVRGSCPTPDESAMK